VTSRNKTDSTQYLWDINHGLPQVLTESDGKGTALYTYGLGRISMADPRQGQMYYQYDGLGSVRSLTDRKGMTRSLYAYDAFGQPLLSASPGDNDFQFTGEQADSETGLVYLRSRYYDPETGRFISRDSFAGFDTAPQTLNRYVYTGNNPVNRIDPSGRLFGLDDLGASELGFLLGELGQYGSDVFNNIGAHKTGLAILNPTSSIEVYSASGAGGAATAVLTLNGAEIGFAVGDVPGAVVGGAAGYFSGASGTSILKDVVSGRDPDLTQAAVNGAIKTTTSLGVNTLLPGGAADQGIIKNAVNQLWIGTYINNKELFQSRKNKLY
jgi:RHS repeat-associated protein